jgi:DNA end-binding protein Ku
LPRQKRNRAVAEAAQTAGAPVRSMWSGTITFGLVSIPVDLMSAVRPRQTAMKLVDKSGHALGREYHCSKDDKELDNDELVRGYATEDGKMVAITDKEFESVAPEMSGDIELRGFVPLEQIPPMYFQRPYFLAPAGKSAKAYTLLATTMERAGLVGIGSFVMRGHEYLAAIISDNGVLRADTLRYADEIRTPESIGLPKPKKAAANKTGRFAKIIEDLTRRELDMSELEDREAQALRELAESKLKDEKNVIHQRGLEEADAEAPEGSAQIIDLMQVLRKSLSKNAVVTQVGAGEPISLAERRAQRAAQESGSTRKAANRRKTPRKKTARKRARRA